MNDLKAHQKKERLSNGGNNKGADQDYYPLYLESEQFLLFHLQGPKGSDFDLSILDKDHQKLAFSTGEKNLETLIVRLPKGMYEVEIEEWKGRGQYILNVLEPNRQFLRLTQDQHLVFFQSHYQQQCSHSSTRQGGNQEIPIKNKRSRFKGDISQTMVVDMRRNRLIDLSDWMHLSKASEKSNVSRASQLADQIGIGIDFYDGQELRVSSNLKDRYQSGEVHEIIEGQFYLSNVDHKSNIKGIYKAEATIGNESAVSTRCYEVNHVYAGARIL